MLIKVGLSNMIDAYLKKALTRNQPSYARAENCLGILNYLRLALT